MNVVEIADGVNGSIYLARGDEVNAALSFAAMIPVVGSAATGAKYVNKASNIVDAGKAANSAKDVGEEVISNSISKASPSELAQSWQGSFPYVGIDKYRDITLKKGKVIYVGEPYPTGYATTKSAVGRANGDARKLFEGLQVKPYWDDGMEAAEYRSKMMAYEITENIDVAFGITKANPQFGEGKLPQIFIHDFDNMIKSGKIKKLESDAINLNNYKMPLDDYNKMLDSLEKLKK